MVFHDFALISKLEPASTSHVLLQQCQSRGLHLGKVQVTVDRSQKGFHSDNLQQISAQWLC